MNYPSVSILIPFRNEEQNIPGILESLDQLNYPKGHFEILMANDDSTDNTANLLEAYAKQKPQARVIHISKTNAHPDLKGKTRALEVLCKAAKGDYFLFTDADISLPREWISGMTAAFPENPKLGVAVGVTSMKPRPLSHALQGMEWLTVLYMLYWLGKSGIEGTGMGNNMAVSKEAYWATGGYAKIPFSIVEDYALYKAIIEQGFEFEQLFNPTVLAYTVPPENLLKQRVRWISGGFQSKSQLGWLGLLQSTWIPLLITLSFFAPTTALCLFIFPFCMNFFFIWHWQKLLHVKGYLKHFAAFSIYLPLAWMIQMVFWLFSKKIEWKGRKY